MKTVVVGAGRIGAAVAKSLALEGQDVTIVDNDPSVIDSVTNSIDIIGVSGSATSYETLTEAGVADADLLVAATDGDEINMVCGICARKLGTDRVIARIRDPQYLNQEEFLKQSIGLSAILNPEYECAKDISRILRFPSAVRVEEFSNGRLESVVFQVSESSALCSRYLKELPLAIGSEVLVCAARHSGKGAVIPNGNFKIEAGDTLCVTGKAKELRKFFVKAGQYKHPVKNVMIAGGSRTAVYLTRMLLEDGAKITIIERNRERCDELTELVPEATIVCGDITDSAVLLEEGAAAADAFVALTGDDDDNIISSLYAKHCSVGTVITKVMREGLSAIFNSVGLDRIIIPTDIIAAQITCYARSMSDSKGGSMESLYRIADGEVEIMEFNVAEDSRLIGTPLKELKFKPNTLISAVIRGKLSSIANGGTIVNGGDRVVVVASAGVIDVLDDIFA